MRRNTRSIIYLVLIAVFAIATITVLVVGMRSKPADSIALPETVPHSTEPIVVTKVVEKEKLVEVEKTITSQILQDGLRDMGVLITQEYYFTEVIQSSSVKQFLKMDIPLTQTSYLATYDGVITAGIDLTQVRVNKNNDANIITVSVPMSTVQNVDVDPNSFKLYSEKSGIGNPLSVSDVNRSLIELENNARATALQKGLLEKADRNAETVIRNFIGSLVDTTQYAVNIEKF